MQFSNYFINISKNVSSYTFVGGEKNLVLCVLDFVLRGGGVYLKDKPAFFLDFGPMLRRAKLLRSCRGEAIISDQIWDPRWWESLLFLTIFSGAEILIHCLKISNFKPCMSGTNT